MVPGPRRRAVALELWDPYLIASDMTDVTVATIAGIATIAASLVAGYFAWRSAQRLKTSNGSTSGELLEFIAEEVSWLRINFVEHARDQELHRIQSAPRDDPVRDK